MNQNSFIGHSGEIAVARYLQKQGFSVKAINHRCRGGEIDLIVENESVRAFVEVKTRSHLYFDTTQVITPSKQRKIIVASYHYNAQAGWPENKSIRFDVAIVHSGHLGMEIAYYPHAFTPNTEWFS